MNDELKAFSKAMKEDRKEAAKLAKAYVKDHREEFAALDGLPLEAVCAMVSAYRAAGKEEECLRADMWAQAEFGPQQIVGQARVGG